MNKKRIVVKIGTSTLTYDNGNFNIRRVESICKIISDLKNSGVEVIVVSSGAIGVGMGKLGLKKRPSEIRKKQALAAVGQYELMYMYDKFFSEYNQVVAQILLTRRVISDDYLKNNVINTLETLIEMNIIPIINENDSVAVDEIIGEHFGDNDSLSSIVARIIKADSLIILTDMDGLYDSDPRKNPDAKLVKEVDQVDENIFNMAGDSSSSCGTGGMCTKLQAAKFVNEAGIDCFIINGHRPKNLYDLMDGKSVGTFFRANKIQ